MILNDKQKKNQDRFIESIDKMPLSQVLRWLDYIHYSVTPRKDILIERLTKRKEELLD